MIHTAELTYRPTSALYQRFIRLDSTRYYQNEMRYTNTSLSHVGITYIKARIASHEGFTRYEFIMRINFNRLIEQQNRVAVVQENDLAAVYDAFKGYIELLMPPDPELPTMPQLTDWYVHRIDYCVNIRTTNVAEYINLLQKSTIPHYYRLDYDQNRNYTQKKGSLYLVSTAKKKNRSTTINIYDKFDQLQKEHESGVEHVSAEVVEQARNILRIEVQCHKSKTDRIAKKYKFENGKKLLEFWKMNVCFDVLEESINRITKNATFQRRSVALQMIDNLKCTKNKKERLQQLLKDIAVQNQSISKVKERYLREKIMTAETFDSYLRYLEINNINAVTISDNKHLSAKSLKEGLPSLYSIFNDSVYFNFASQNQS